MNSPNTLMHDRKLHKIIIITIIVPSAHDSVTRRETGIRVHPLDDRRQLRGSTRCCPAVRLQKALSCPLIASALALPRSARPEIPGPGILGKGGRAADRGRGSAGAGPQGPVVRRPHPVPARVWTPIRVNCEP